MARSQLFEGIFTTLQTDPTLPLLLGPPVAQNPRLMRGFPQLQNLLATGYEPASTDAWLVFLEPDPYPRAQAATFENAFEVVEIQFAVLAVRYDTADLVADVLDSYWHWTVEQQRDIQYGERILLATRRYRTEESYAKDLKLPQKSLWYRMRFTLETQHA